jgi:hypothetical protein
VQFVSRVCHGALGNALQQLVHEHRALDGIGIALIELEEERCRWLDVDGPCSAVVTGQDSKSAYQTEAEPSMTATWHY